MTLVAIETLWDADMNRIGRAVVRDADDPNIGIACVRTGACTWEAVYLVTFDADVRELPPCFSLSMEALAALDLMTIRSRTP